MTISDGVVTLRAPRDEDHVALATLGTDAAVVRWIDGIDADYGLEQARSFAARAEERRRSGRAVLFAIADATTDEILGDLEIQFVDRRRGTAQIGYLLLPAARGRGYATRAVLLAARFARDQLEMTEIQALVHPENVASQRVLERAGFTRGELVPEARGPDEPRFVYRLTPGEAARLARNPAAGRRSGGRPRRSGRR